MRTLNKIFMGLIAIFIVMHLPVFADSKTEWQDHQGMISTRILSASKDVANEFPSQVNMSSETVLLAWEAKLSDGWKTYWRSPGEAGLPVRLFVGEQQIELMYPFPERFELFGLETYGYSKQVVIPFEVNVTDIQNGLNLKADFMVCKDICVPFQAEYNIDIDPANVGDITSDVRVKNALANVPLRGDAISGGLTINSVKLSGMPGHQTLIVDASADSPLAKADVLAEAGDSIQFRSPRMRLQGDGRSARFILPVISTEAKHDLSGKTVRVTFADGRGNAIDRFFDLAS